LYIPGKEVGKTRAIVNTFAKQEKEATPGQAIEILGFTETLPAGSLVYTMPRSVTPAEVQNSSQSSPTSLAQFFAAPEEKIKIILKTETSAEFEAIQAALSEDVELVSSGQGDITVNDIHLAKDFKAIVIGFDVDIARDAKALAETEGVFYRLYTVIYEMLDELADVAIAMAEDAREKILGKATIITSFLGSSGVILGVNVIEGRLALNDKVRIMRDEKVVGESKIVSIKRSKQDVKDVARGNECGIILAQELDFRPHDMVLSYK
jgi:translation initiation factor IF-2